MQITSTRDFVTRSLLHHGDKTYEIDLVHFGHDLKSDSHDAVGLIPRGHAEAAARRITSSLWGVSPAMVQVSSQVTFFGKTAPMLLSTSHAVAWPVTSKVAKTTYHVLRPVSAVARFGRDVLVTFSDGELIRYDGVALVSACCTHTWTEIQPSVRYLARFAEWCSRNSIEPYTDRHPVADELMLGPYCKSHDLFGCWFCKAQTLSPVPELTQTT